MKNLIIILALFSFTIVNAQKNLDLGIFAGTTTYWGDYNRFSPFSTPGYAAGGMARFNLNPRYAFRLSGYYGKISATRSADDPIVNGFASTDGSANSSASFSSNILDFALQGEFNFLPIVDKSKKIESSSYLTMGIGYGLANFKSHLINIPLGLGYKIQLNNRVCIGAEAGVRKNLNKNSSDNLDGVSEIIGNNLINNNDWYTFAGLFITYKFYKFATHCPAYD
ncbi:MAG: DUF6089 family protein [Bacteroidales bacterium]|nr:DUF6089 family protein [Bacteroidales bacterium]